MIDEPNPVFAPVTMTVLPAKEVVVSGSLPKSWLYTNLAKNARERSPGMFALEEWFARVEWVGC